MKELISRTVTGALFVVILLAGVYFSKVTFLLVFIFIIILSSLEFYKLANYARVKPQKFLGTSLGVLFFILNFAYASDYINIKVFLFFIPFIVLVFISEIYRFSKRPFHNIAYTIMGLVYIALPLSLLNYIVLNIHIAQPEIIEPFNSDIAVVDNVLNFFYFISPRAEASIYNPNLLLGFFFILWSYDTFAYLAGITVGKHRLFKRVSPKKSWEGLFGGSIITFFVTYIVAINYTEISIFNWFVIAAIIIIMATFGDLVESIFKRSINVKDSGNIMPGHGGILDRFDGVFLSAPFVFIYLSLLLN